MVGIERPFYRKKNMSINYHIFQGAEASTEIEQLGVFRVKQFRAFPYLYAGTLNDEREYLKSYLDNPDFVLAVAKDGEKTVAVSSANPLPSDVELEALSKEQFRQRGWNTRDFYYFGEMIVLPEYRHLGIASKLLEMQYVIAAKNGYHKFCFLAVKREADDPHRPKSHTDSAEIFTKLGYTHTDMFVTFSWPTILADGTVQKTENRLDFWVSGE